VLEPLLRARVVSASLAAKVAGKATAKIMARHARDAHAGFLVSEYSSITKLVSALVEHYSQQQQQQQPQQQQPQQEQQHL
jgi:hypothetical protein